MLKVGGFNVLTADTGVDVVEISGLVVQGLYHIAIGITEPSDRGEVIDLAADDTAALGEKVDAAVDVNNVTGLENEANVLGRVYDMLMEVAASGHLIQVLFIDLFGKVVYVFFIISIHGFGSFLFIHL